MAILVSACLLGINCRYDGGSCYNSKVAAIAQAEGAIPVCPEQLGGCATPRPAAEIQGGSGADILDGCCCIKNNVGQDVTAEFIKGASEVLKIANTTGACKAILKARSPSCGKGLIYDGTFKGVRVEGNGVTAELLVRNGLEVITEDDLR